jgi:hypothetical protein
LRAVYLYSRVQSVWQLLELKLTAQCAGASPKPVRPKAKALGPYGLFL